MHFGIFFGGFLMSLFISHIQAKPLFFSAYQDEGFENDLDDYFIDLDGSRTPILRVNPFALPTDNEPVVEIFQDYEDPLFHVVESPVVYADRFEHAFDEAAGRLENILRLAVKKFKESFIHTFEIITNHSPTDESTISPSIDGDKVVGNITSSIEKENENQIEGNNTDVTESENKRNLIEGNANKAIIETKTTVDKNEAMAKVKNTMDVKTAVDNEVKPDGEVIPENEVKLTVGKVVANKTFVNKIDHNGKLSENNSNKATFDAESTNDSNKTTTNIEDPNTAVDREVKSDSKTIHDNAIISDVAKTEQDSLKANENKQE